MSTITFIGSLYAALLHEYVEEPPGRTNQKGDGKTLKPKRGRSELKFAEIIGRKNEAVGLAHYIMDTRRFDRETQEHHKEEETRGKRAREGRGERRR